MPQQQQVAHNVPSSTLSDVLERVLDKGVVIAGDIKIKLVDIELLSIQIRLVICSVDKAIAYAADRDRITRDDLLAVGITGNEENIFALLDAIGRRDCGDLLDDGRFWVSQVAGEGEKTADGESTGRVFRCAGEAVQDERQAGGGPVGFKHCELIVGNSESGPEEFLLRADAIVENTRHEIGADFPVPDFALLVEGFGFKSGLDLRAKSEYGGKYAHGLDCMSRTAGFIQTSGAR